MSARKEAPIVVVLVEIREPDGSQRWIPFYAIGDDHEAAAAQAFASIGGRGTIVNQLTTFDGPGRRWDTRHGVEERK